MCSSDLFLGFLALLFPPLPVWVKSGICSGDSLINILLCMLGYVPGLLHAWYIIAKHPEPVAADDYRGSYGPEDGRARYVRVGQAGDEEAAGRQPAPKPRSQPGRQANMSYGSAAGSSSAAAAAAAPPASASAPYDYNGGEGSSEDSPPPPSYAEVVGDHKIQDRS